MSAVVRFALGNPRAVTVLVLALSLAGGAALAVIPADILPSYRSPAVQSLTFYGGMPASSVEADITARMERWTGQAGGTARVESRSIVGASIVRNYFADDVDPSAALTMVNSLATAAVPTMPPGTLPPVILPYDPTSATPVALVALNSRTQGEASLFDTARYQVRSMIMASPGANAPVVYGGKARTVLAYLDRQKMQARQLSPVEVMEALDRSNVFLPAGGAKLGGTDYALDSNSMYDLVELMGDVPVRSDARGTVFLRDVALPRDAALVQTSVVRVDGRRQVYIPVYRQAGASTLGVVGKLAADLPDMKARVTTPDVDLKLVFDQSVYVRNAIISLAEEGVLGAVLCSLVILLFLGEWRMTVIAVATIPVAVLGSVAGLYALGQTVNVMTLAGLALAVGPLVDSAIICLENTHRHLGLGEQPAAAAYRGAVEVALPELAASLCTLLVLLPLTLVPGLGPFLFKPMFLAVALAMAFAYLLSRTLVPSRCAAWLKPHAAHHHAEKRGLFARWERLIETGIAGYVRLLDAALRQRRSVVGLAFAGLAAVLVLVGPRLRREFFPEVDAGSFEVFVRCPSGTRIEATEGYVEAVEGYVKYVTGDDLLLVVSEVGLTADWSAAFTPNSGPMDAVVKVQLKPERSRSAQEYVSELRAGLARDPAFDKRLGEVDARKRAAGDYPPGTPAFARGNLEVAFDAGGMIRSAMNEGKSSPMTLRVTAKDLGKARAVADRLLPAVRAVPGVVDARIIQRLDYPQYVIDVDRAKAASLGLTQREVMQNVVAALNSSVAFNKKNFWIDPASHNQYYVGVGYPEGDISSLDTLLDVPVTSPSQRRSIPLRNVATVRPMRVPAEIVHTNLQPTVELTLGVEGRDLGHVADDVAAAVAPFGAPRGDGTWTPFDPTRPGDHPMEGARLTLSGEYGKMLATFRSQAVGMAAAVLLVYFLLVALFRSYILPLVVLSAVPVGLIGVVLALWLTGTAVNVQSLLGVIFMVGIVVSNTVLLADFAVTLQRADRLTPTEAIRRAAAVRVRPVVMAALATFFALVPMSLGLARGSEANVPLGRAVLGGLLAGLATTLVVVPCVYSLLVPNRPERPGDPLPGDPGYVPPAVHGS